MALLTNRCQLRQPPLLKPLLKQSDCSRYLAFSVALSYALLGILWIAWSDRLWARLSPSAEVFTELQILKVWFFVGFTSLMLYGLIRRGVDQLHYKHQLLQSIINFTNDAIFVKDVQGRFLVVNQTAAELLGAHPADILGRAAEEFFTPQEAQQMRWIEQEILRTEQSEEVEELLTINGESRWFLTTKSLCLDEQSRPLGIVGIARDLTEHKQAEEVLRDSEERLRLALTAAKQGLYDVNVQTGEVIVNPAYAIMLGYDPAEFQETADQWSDRLHPDDRETAIPLYQAYTAGEVPEYKSEFRLQTQSGDWKWILSLGKIVSWDADGKPLRMLGTHTDISDRKQVEEEIRRAETLRVELKLLENILEVILAGYWDWDIPNHQEYLSPTFKRMFGYEEQELPNTPETWQRLIFAEDLPRVMECLDQHVQSRGQSPFFNEVRYRHKNGSTIWVICSGRVIEWDQDGNPLRAIGCHVNITDRKQAEEALRESERRFKAVFNQQFQFMAILSPDGTVIEANDTCLKVTGVLLEQVLGYRLWETPWFNQLPLMQERWQQGIAEVVSGGGPVTGEVEYNMADGTVQFATYAITGLKDDTGQVVNIITEAEGVDFTKRKQVEQALRESERRYATLTKVAPVAICQFDAAGHCVYANDRWSEMTGRPTETALGMGWVQTLPPEDRDRISREWSQALEHKGFFQNESRCLRPDGNITWFYAQVLPETDSNGTIIGYVGTLTDITERKRIEDERKQVEQRLQQTNKQLAHANAELARATRLKNEFLANMSHELRTPLNSILGMSEVLKEKIFGELNEKQQQYIEIISQSGKHLLKLINDILDLAKIESGKLELEITPTSVQSLCSSSLSLIKQIAHQKKIKLETHIPSQMGEINVDELRMRQALINLLSNSVKFTPEGGQVILEVRRDRTHQMIQFSVIDTGIGIDPEHLPKLFQSFVQIDSSLNRQYSGTGLGLALVKQIAELHHGTVDVVSTAGQGSCFTITLPSHSSCDLMQVQATQHELELPPKPSFQGDDSTSADTPQSQPLILLAEDNQANIETFSNYLTIYGFRLVTATNGQEAVDLAREHQPDVILMDIQMPGVDGLEAIRRLREDREFVNVPIIALTALAMSGDREKCLAAGANEYFTKPVSLKQLITVIQQLLAVSKRHL